MRNNFYVTRNIFSWLNDIEFLMEWKVNYFYLSHIEFIASHWGVIKILSIFVIYFGNRNVNISEIQVVLDFYFLINILHTFLRVITILKFL